MYKAATKTVTLVLFFILINQAKALEPQSFIFEHTVEDRNTSLYNVPETAQLCAKFCSQTIAEIKEKADPKKQKANYRCAYDSELRQFGRGDYRRVPTSCKVIEMFRAH